MIKKNILIFFLMIGFSNFCFGFQKGQIAKSTNCGRFLMTLATASSVALMTLLPQTSSVRADDEQTAPVRAPDEVNRVLMTPQVQAAIERGLKYLADTQVNRGDTGYWEGTQYRYVDTSLAGLALLSTGTTPKSGPYQVELNRVIEYILKGQLPSGVIGDQQSLAERPMFQQGFAALFLSQVYGESNDEVLNERIKIALKQLVQVIQSAQSNQGGWYYSVDNSANRDEGSVTVTQVQALRAIRDVGLYTSKEVIDRGLEYLYKSQANDKGIKYQISNANTEKSNLPISIAGLCVLYSCGDYSSAQLNSLWEFVLKGLLIEKDDAFIEMLTSLNYFYYTHFYLSQAMFQRGGADWERYYNNTTKILLSKQSQTGGWDLGSESGPAFSTAIAIIILSMPYQYLPMMTR